MLEMVVGVAVGVLILAAALFPVIDQATTTEHTFTNEGYYDYGIFEPTDTYTLTVDVSTGAVTVGDAAVTIPSAVYGPGCSLISSEDFLLRYGQNPSGYFLQAVGIDYNGSTVAQGFAGTVICTINNGNLIMSYDSSGTPSSKTFSFDEMYAIVADTDEAVLKKMAESVYIKGDSPIYASGLTSVAGGLKMLHFEGNYTDGITISSPNLPDATYSNIEWNIEPVSGYVDLYKLTSIEFDVTNSGTTVHAVYSYFGVPEKVTAELAVHPSQDEIELLETIPILITVGLIMGIVGVIAARRFE